jgi:hypothetical protein
MLTVKIHTPSGMDVLVAKKVGTARNVSSEGMPEGFKDENPSRVRYIYLFDSLKDEAAPFKVLDLYVPDCTGVYVENFAGRVVNRWTAWRPVQKTHKKGETE